MILTKITIIEIITKMATEWLNKQVTCGGYTEQRDYSHPDEKLQCVTQKFTTGTLLISVTFYLFF